jgi:hypothetical protein
MRNLKKLLIPEILLKRDVLDRPRDNSEDRKSRR